MTGYWKVVVAVSKSSLILDSIRLNTACSRAVISADRTEHLGQLRHGPHRLGCPIPNSSASEKLRLELHAKLTTLAFLTYLGFSNFTSNLHLAIWKASLSILPPV